MKLKMKFPERITDTHIYFWGSYLSQWSNHSFEDRKLKQKFLCGEQYMMYCKALIFKDKESCIKIMLADNPRDQKAAGRLIKNFDQEIWDQHKYKIILRGNFLKFSQNEKIKEELLKSNKILVEASPFDRIYGIGIKFDDDKILDESNWKGKNLLGKALMEVREKLKKPLITEIKGSITDATEDIIAHGCNCYGGFNSGVAGAIKKSFPKAREEYLKKFESESLKLGEFQIVETDKIIINCFTQVNYGKNLEMDKKSILDRYKAIESSLNKVYKYAKDNNKSVAIPRIGCGLARLDWENVKKIVGKVFDDYPVSIYYIPPGHLGTPKLSDYIKPEDAYDVEDAENTLRKSTKKLGW